MDTIPSEDLDAALTLTDTLDHLPASKRRELARVLEILFDEVQTFRAHKLSDRKNLPSSSSGSGPGLISI